MSAKGQCSSLNNAPIITTDAAIQTKKFSHFDVVGFIAIGQNLLVKVLKVKLLWNSSCSTIKFSLRSKYILRFLILTMFSLFRLHTTHARPKGIPENCSRLFDPYGCFLTHLSSVMAVTLLFVPYYLW